jgi:hypothetical protein
MIATAAVSGVTVGIIAALPQSSGWFLVGLQSLAAGAMLSVLLVGTAATFRCGRPRWPLALAAATVAVVAQHVALYYTALHHRERAYVKEPAVELFRPGWTDPSFLEYMATEATTTAMLLWTLDACLLALAAVVIVEVSARERTSGSDS